MNEFSPADTEWQSPIENGFSADESYAQETADVAKDEVPNGHDQVDRDPFGEEEQQQPEDNQNTRRKRKNPFQKRIDQLVYEKGAMEQNAAFLASQLAEKEARMAQQAARLAEYESQLEEKDEYANQSFENNLDTHVRSIKQRMRQAQADGEDVTDLFEELAEAKAVRAAHEAHKIQERTRRQYERQEEEYEPYETNVQQPYQALPPQYLEFKEWEAQNQWYQNPKLKQEADGVADELAKIFTFNNQPDLIGTPEFYGIVTNEMSKRYGLARSNQQSESEYEDEDAHYERQPTMAVAPVSRRTAAGESMAQNYMSSQGGPRNGRMTLTREEMDIARNLHYKHKNEGERDLLARYAKAKAYPKSPYQGGSPNRLTIL